MDLRKLKTLIDLVSESNVSELEITEAEGKVRIIKGPVAVAQSSQGSASVAPTPVAGRPTDTEPGAPTAVTTGATSHTVKSPMVGTFYRSASPGTKAFVEVGDSIKVGQTVCIIEAMKILNEIDADQAGTVVQVFCVNGQAVEYGQPLFLID